MTLVADPEQIIRRGRDSQRQTSKSTRGTASGTSRGTSSVVSNRPPFKYSSTEASSSQKIISESKNLKVEEYSTTFVVVDQGEEKLASLLRQFYKASYFPYNPTSPLTSIPGNSTGENLPPIPP